MGANVVSIRGRDVPGVRLTLTVLGLHPERIGGTLTGLTVSSDSVVLGHLTVEGGQLPQPRGVLPVQPVIRVPVKNAGVLQWWAL